MPISDMAQIFIESVLKMLPPINSGNTSYILFCAAMVMVMTPALAFFYGGLVQKKNLLTIMMQCFVSAGVSTILWVAVGYSMCFGPSMGGIIGDPTHYAFMRNMSLTTLYNNDPVLGIPLLVHFVYQMMFAIITPTLITGAFANRMSFKAWLWILVLWQLFIYYPFVHMIWSPEGMMAKWGVLDFAGGVVVHNTAGFASIASVLYLGKRKVVHDHPHSLTMVAVGTTFLWFGWFCFNSGSEFRVDQIEVSAFVNTHLAAGFAGVVWLIYEWIHTGKPKVLGFMTGSIAGLATITPAVGFVSPTMACVIGMLASLVCYSAVLFKNKIGLDDALDVWPVHGVGGLMGMLWLGLFADKTWNPTLWSNGLLFGGDPKFFGVQVLSVVVSSIWAFFVTLAIFWVVDRITKVRVPESFEEVGLDISLHGELAEVNDH